MVNAGAFKNYLIYSGRIKVLGKWALKGHIIIGVRVPQIVDLIISNKWIYNIIIFIILVILHIK